MVRYLTAPVVDGRADWPRAIELPETAELWRRRAVLWRAQRDRLAAGSRAIRPAPAAKPPPDVALAELRTEHRLTRQVAAYALERLMRHPAVSHQGVDRVRAYLAGERRLP